MEGSLAKPFQRAAPPWAAAGETSLIYEHVFFTADEPWHVTLMVESDTSDDKNPMETMCSVNTNTDIDLTQIDPARIRTGGNAQSGWVQLVSSVPATGLVEFTWMPIPKAGCGPMHKGPVATVQLDFKSRKDATAAADGLRRFIKLARTTPAR